MSFYPNKKSNKPSKDGVVLILALISILALVFSSCNKKKNSAESTDVYDQLKKEKCDECSK